jgi:predicted TIM-barrel fold metal-dependent hydrolase
LENGRVRNGHLVIDADGHVMEPSDLWERYIDPTFLGVSPRCDPNSPNLEVLGHRMSRSATNTDYMEFNISSEVERFGEARARGFDSASHLEMMAAEGIDLMVLFPTRGLFALAVADMDGRVAAAIGRAYNKWLRDYCAAAPDKLAGVALVGLHDPDLAAAEARYAVEELDLCGIMVRPNPVHGRNMHDPAYDAFYSTLEELDVPLTIHEGCGVWMPEYGIDRFSEHIVWHAMCHPMEQMGAVVSFTLGGVMERHPRLKVAFLESGATWLPYWLHRLDEHVEWLGHIEAKHLSMLPTEYFKRQGWITLESDEPNLRGLVDFVGADRLLWASDYPHPDSKYPGAVDALFAADGLTDADRRLILQNNPAALYRLGVRARQAEQVRT